MFNCYQYEKKLNEKKQLDQDKKEYIEYREKRQKKTDQLSQQYKKRIENFVVNMMEQPTTLIDYKGPSDFRFRVDEPQKFLGDAQIYVKGFKREKDRIALTMEKNKNLDFEPGINVNNYNYRERHVEKEVQPELRFTSFKTSLDRLQAFVKENFMNEVENDDFRKVKKKKKIEESMPESLTLQQKRALMAQDIAKNVMPSLHNKTHFKATSALYNQSPLCLTDKAVLQKSLKDLQKPKRALFSQSAIHNQSKSMSTLGNVNNRYQNTQNSNLDNILGDLNEGNQNQTTTFNLNLENQSPKNQIQKSVKINENGNILDTDDRLLERQSTFQNRQSIQNLENGNSPNNGGNNSKINKKNQILEAFNPVQSSKNILEKCNVIKPRNEKVKVLKSGEGHLISTQDKTVHELYDQLYHNKSKLYNNSHSHIPHNESTRSQTNIMQTQVYESQYDF